MKESCYYLKEYFFENPIFNEVDATYIIHLEGNKRLDIILDQLKYYYPSKKLYILFNKGFKKCKKEEYINKPPLDVIDAFYYCFNDANKKNYENILILEDDFIFDKKILERAHSNKIDKFLYEKNKKKEIFIYYIGTITYLQSAFGEYHNKLFLSVGSHSCIYPKSFIKYLLNNVPKKSLNDWDFFTNFNFPRYKYYTPLCYQILTETENSKYWNQGNFFLKYLFHEFRKYQIYINLNKHYQPGFNIMEISSRIIFWIIIITFLFILYLIFFKLNKLFYNKNQLFYLILLLLIILYPILIINILLTIVYILSNFYIIK